MKTFVRLSRGRAPLFWLAGCLAICATAFAADPGDPCPQQADNLVAATKAVSTTLVKASDALAALKQCTKSLRAWVGLCGDKQTAADDANAAFADATAKARQASDAYFTCRKDAEKRP